MVDDFEPTGWERHLSQEVPVPDDAAERRLARYHAQARAMVEEASARVEKD